MRGFHEPSDIRVYTCRALRSSSATGAKIRVLARSWASSCAWKAACGFVRIISHNRGQSHGCMMRCSSSRQCLGGRPRARPTQARAVTSAAQKYVWTSAAAAAMPNRRPEAYLHTRARALIITGRPPPPTLFPPAAAGAAVRATCSLVGTAWRAPVPRCRRARACMQHRRVHMRWARLYMHVFVRMMGAGRECNKVADGAWPA